MAAREDGKIIIGTDLNTKEFDKKIIQLERKAEKKQIDIQVSTQNVKSTKKQLELVNEELESVQNQLDGISKDAQRLAELEFKFLSGKPLTSGEAAEYFGLNSTEIAQQEQELLKKMQKLTMQQDTLNTKLTMQNQKLQEAKNSYSDIQQEIVDVKEELANNATNSIQGSFENIGNSISKIIKKVTRWGLAIFSLRSAYMAVRNSVNILVANDEQLKADIEYIKTALAYTLEPIIRTIVDLVKDLLTYIGYIIYRWTGKNIFENANKSLKKTTTQAQKLQKILTSFDEVNILGDNSSDSSGSIMPSFDLSEITDSTVPKWVDWLANNKDTLKTIAELLLIAFGITNISEILRNISTLFGVSGGVGLIGLSELLMLIATPIVITIAVKNVKKVINEVKKLNDVIHTNTEISEENKNSHKQYADLLIEKIKNQELDNEQIKSSTNYLMEHGRIQKQMIENTKGQETWLTRLTGSSKELKKQYEAMRDELEYDIDIWNEFTKAGEVSEEQQRIFNQTMWENIQALEQAGIDTTSLTKKYNTLSGLRIVPQVDNTKAQSALDKLLNKLGKIFNTKWSLEVNANFSTGGGNAGGGGSGHGFAKGGIAYYGLPKLAPGGIINQPGRGVPIASAIGGERGMEGVIPLTDSQQMALLGEMIGKYVTINLTNINEMNGHILSRELKKMQNEEDFAFNK